MGHPEIGPRVAAIIPWLRDLLEGKHPPPEVVLGRNVALHARDVPANICGAPASELRRSQHGPRLGAGPAGTGGAPTPAPASPPCRRARSTGDLRDCVAESSERLAPAARPASWACLPAYKLDLMSSLGVSSECDVSSSGSDDPCASAVASFVSIASSPSPPDGASPPAEVLAPVTSFLMRADAPAFCPRPHVPGFYPGPDPWTRAREVLRAP